MGFEERISNLISKKSNQIYNAVYCGVWNHD